MAVLEEASLRSEENAAPIAGVAMNELPTQHLRVYDAFLNMRQLIVMVPLLAFWNVALQARSLIYPVAPELRSDHFHVIIGRQESPVAYAATTYFFLNFAVKGKTRISITADTDDYWNKGVEVQPWRWGIRPRVKGRTITFTVAEKMKLCVSRPGDHGAGAEMLFLFANAPEVDPPKLGQAGVRFYGPRTYRENIDAKSGETIYLAPGAVVFGALNLWGVNNVKVMGRGTIVYDGPQNPDHDEGWMHKPNWHAIVMDHARNIQINGITFIVRSRTWMIQMLGSHDITFENIKVIGGCKGNANQDGMDWLGGGDTVVRDSFFRASDDVFALQGNWLGYDAKAMATPGDAINNILVENSVLSTSISNIVRVSWPAKVFDSNHFQMTNSDVIHMGMGGCVIPFGLLEIWNDPTGKGRHSDYSFENIRLEEWYSMLQLRYPPVSVRNVILKNVWALDSPSLVRAHGRIVHHKFTDVKGSLLDGSGRFRVLLKVRDASGREDWDSQPVVVANDYAPPLLETDKPLGGGWNYQYFEGASLKLDDLSRLTPSAVGTTRDINATKAMRQQHDYALVFDGMLDVPADGGYTFFLLANDSAELEIDSHAIAISPEPKTQVCGMIGNMVQMVQGSMGLKAGKHSVHVAMTHSTGSDGFALKWEGPGRALADVTAPIQ